MTKLKIIVAVCTLAVSGFAIADSYQSEIGLTYQHHDYDNFTDTHDYTLDGKYYFNQVNIDNLPLAEAAFLGQNSNVFGEWLKSPRQNKFPSFNQYNVGAEFYMRENFLYVKAGASRISSQRDDNDWFTTVGITPINGLLLTTEYSHDAGYDANIHGKYVTDIAGHFINVEAGVADTDGKTYRQVGGDWYFDNTFSLGVNYVDGIQGEEYSIRTRKFFTQQISGELSYTDFSFGSEILAGVKVRF